MTIHNFKNTTGETEGIRHVIYENRDHLVVPVVMIVEGVLEGSDGPALLHTSEFSKYPESWNGRPVCVRHPATGSAAQPDVMERVVLGSLFNTTVVNGKLKSEAWIDVEKAERLGYANLIHQMEAGQLVEVSTGYFSDAVEKEGEFNGVAYDQLHVNLRPDHLAILPDEEGACSVADGCGTRTNKRSGVMTKITEALHTLQHALGLQTNCQCQESDNMSKNFDERVKALTANGKLSAKQIEQIQDMDPEQRRMMSALLDSMVAEGADPEPEVTEEVEVEANEYEDKDPMYNASSAPSLNQKALDKLVSNRVNEALRRHEVTRKLTANSACPYDENELAELSVNHLEKLEKSIRPADYSAQGGFATNSAQPEEGVEPLKMNRGVLGRKKTSGGDR